MSSAQPTVLIVDDEELIRFCLTDWFEDRGWRCLSAATGREALDLLEREEPQGAVIDVRVGAMDGNEIILQARELCPRMVYVVCTGSPEYSVPDELRNEPRLSPVVFKKPVTNLGEMEKELRRLVAWQASREPEA